MKYKIELVNHGIANRFPDGVIQIHKKMAKDLIYRPLLREIIEHEMYHTDTGYSWHDFKLDLKGFKNKGLYRRFVLTTPSAWVQFSPVYKANKRWYFDMTLLISYSIIIVFILIIYFLYG